MARSFSQNDANTIIAKHQQLINQLQEMIRVLNNQENHAITLMQDSTFNESFVSFASNYLDCRDETKIDNKIKNLITQIYKSGI